MKTRGSHRARRHRAVRDRRARAGPTQAPARSWSSSWPRACATPTSTSPPATSAGRRYPIVGGHEGAGIVEKVGRASPGPQAGRPRHLLVPAVVRALPLVRERASKHLRHGRHDPRRHAVRRHLPLPRSTATAPRAADVHASRTFVETTTDLRRTPAVKVADDVPLDKAVLIGCGVPTGWGSAVHAAADRAGRHHRRLGVGGIGINAVQGAAQAGAANVVAVDPVAEQARDRRAGRRHARRRRPPRRPPS